MMNKGDQKRLGVTDSDLGSGSYPLGSGHSRAATRAMLAARKESRELRFVVISTVDGKPANLEALADPNTAAKRRIIVDL